MRLRQVALVAHDLQPVVDDLCAVLGLEVAFRDPGVREFGLHNAVMPVGDTFLEVVSPLEANTTAGRLLERRGGDGGYMVILQTDRLDADRARIERLGVRIVWNIDLPDARTIHLHPRDVGGAIVSFDEMTPPASWRWAGPRWPDCVHTDLVSGITGVEVQAADVIGMVSRWAEVLDRPATRRERDVFEIGLDAGMIRFVPAADGRGDGVAGIELAVVHPAPVLAAARARGIPVTDDVLTICGTGIRLTAPPSGATA